MAKILAIAGSFREHAYSKRVLAVAAEGARQAGGEITTIDLRDFPMPLYNADEHEKNGFDAKAAELQAIFAEHDGFLISSPEYNGTIPGGFKNAIDWVSRANGDLGVAGAFKGKNAALMASSPGSFGGIRCLSHLRGMLSILFVNVDPVEIAVSFVSQKFDGNSVEMTDEKTKFILEDLGKRLVDSLS